MKSYESLLSLQAELRDGSQSCASVVDYYLKQISDNEHLNAFLEVYEHEARERATSIDEKITSGAAGKLAGLVIGIKDNICYKDHRVSASSKILEGFESVYNSTVVERLLAEDAIIIGRLNCDEFAMGSSNENSAFGPVLNPHDNDTVPGGSSGGTVAAVAADMCRVALGTDTGGSIRQPASFCGLVGLKPTYGRVSRYGIIAYASSFDQVGPVAKSVEDVALVLEVIAGSDDYDSTAVSKEVPAYSSSLNLSDKPKIAVLGDCLRREGLDSEISEAVKKWCANMVVDGCQVNEVEFPYLDYMVPTYHVLANAEASSNLSRYDGIHYGFRSDSATELESAYVDSRTVGFGAEVKRRIMLGTFVLSEGYYDAYYSRAQKVRRIIKDKTREILRDHDVILLPTTPTTAFKLGANVEDPITMYLQDIFTIQANLSGSPAISLPLGSHSNGMPFGIQLIADNFEEQKLLAVSNYLMKFGK